MKTGKVSGSVLKRSVFRQLKTKRSEVASGAAAGEDCAVLNVYSGETLLSTSPVTVSGTDMALYGIHSAVNNIAACGGQPVAVLLTILLPDNCEESELKNLMKQAEKTCSELQIEIAGGHTEVTDAVNRIMLTVTAVGYRKNADAEAENSVASSSMSAGTARPGAELVMTGWAGLEGTSIAAKKTEKKLLERFPAYLVEEARNFDRYLSVIPEAAVAAKSGVWAVTDVSKGGVFGALWKMAELSGVGLEIDLKKIPIRQETVEICNFLDLNPYELVSGGSLLIAAENGNDLVEAMEKTGIRAAVIGKTTDGNDRVIRNGEEKRFLEPAKTDEIHKLI